MAGTITNPSGDITAASNGDSFAGQSTTDVTIDSGVTITADPANLWELDAGATLTLNGNLALIGGDQLSTGLTPDQDARIIVGPTGTLSVGANFAEADAGQIAFGATGGTIEIQPGQPSSILPAIGNIQPGDHLQLDGIVADYTSTSPDGIGTSFALYNQGNYVETFDLDGLAANAVTGFSFTTIENPETGVFSTIMTAECFTAGTRILTTKGEIAVEDLKPGDQIITQSGPRSLRWLGRSTVSTRFGDPLRVLPIRIRAGALAPNTPSRDLLVSPDHALFLDNTLIHASALINHTTITRETEVPEVFTYYHVELDAHELILAENTLTESFVDNTGRMNFDNWADHQSPTTPIAELPYPRAKSARQLPASLRAA